MIFLFEEKVMLCSRILIFEFLVNPQTLKTMTSSQTLPNIGSYACDCFSRILTRAEITCSKLTIKIPERRQWRHSGVFIVKFEHISHLVLVFLLLTLNR